MRVPSLLRFHAVFGFAGLLVATVACSAAIPLDDDENGLGPNGSSSSGGFGSSGASSSGMASSSSGNGCGDVALESAKTPVDVILTIDTSGSMDDEIVQVRTNINNFVATLGSSGLDYRVIVIGGRDGGQNALVVPTPLAGPNGADNAPKFHHLTTNVGSSDAWTKILSSHPTWGSFVRTEAFKVFITFTDDEASYSGGSAAATNFDRDLLTKPGFGTTAKRNYSYNSVVGWKEGTPVTSTSKCSGTSSAGMNHRALSTLTGGLIDSICKTDFSGVFASISKGVSAQLACDVTLPAGPGADSTKVVVEANGTEFVPVTDVSKCGTVPNGWYFDDDEKKHVKLCDAACTTARTVAKLNVKVGCVSQIPR